MMKAGIVEHFQLYKMESKMTDNNNLYSLVNFSPIFFRRKPF